MDSSLEKNTCLGSLFRVSPPSCAARSSSSRSGSSISNIQIQVDGRVRGHALRGHLIVLGHDVYQLLRRWYEAPGLESFELSLVFGLSSLRGRIRSCIEMEVTTSIFRSRRPSARGEAQRWLVGGDPCTRKKLSKPTGMRPHASPLGTWFLDDRAPFATVVVAAENSKVGDRVAYDNY